MKNAEKLYSCLREINSGNNAEEIRRREPGLINSITPSDLAVAEQMLLESGCSIAEIRRRQHEYIALTGDQLYNMWKSLPHSHIARKILAEHEIYLCMLSDLKEVNCKIQKLDTITDTCTEIRKLAHVVQHLVSSRDHSLYEEEILYPELSRLKLGHLIRAMKSDHAYIKFALNSLVKLLEDFDDLDICEFKTRLQSVSSFVATSIGDHIFMENHILLPLAVELIENEQVWERMKQLCDDLGYCGLHDSEI